MPYHYFTPPHGNFKKKEYFKNFLWWLTKKRMLINKKTGTMHYYHC